MLFGFPLAVETVNDFDVAPAGTTMFGGTEARDGFELVNVTSAPPTGAGAANVTIAEEDEPPTRVVGLRRKVTTGGGGDGRTVKVIVFVVPL